MTQIKPFCATIYNPSKIADLDRVFCPPYDVISPAEQDYYYQNHPYNFIRLILNKHLPGDNAAKNRYQRAQDTFSEWLRQEILTKDAQPAIYFYLQEYLYQGEKKRRWGFIAALRLEDEGGRNIYPHEKTHLVHKEDRLELLKKVRANLSPIFVLFSDREKNIAKISNRLLTEELPFIDIRDKEQTTHKLWRLTDEPAVNKIISDMQDKSLFIADGHHRFEVAAEYRRQMIEEKGFTSGKEDFNYIMSYFTDLDSRELLILPTHRIVKKFSGDITILEDNFRIQKLKTREELGVLLAKAGINEHAFGLYQKDKVFLLRLKSEARVDKIIPDGSVEFRRLDVNLLKYFIFNPLNIVSEDLIYTNDAKSAMDRVDRGEVAAVFLLNPVKVAQLREIALAGERMPQKTTYFYPKVLSGLVVSRFEEL